MAAARMSWKRRSIGLAALVAVAALVALAAWHVLAPRRTPAGQPPLVRLAADNFDVLRAAINERAGETRVLVLLSPT
jgi:hypothetical protein